MISEKPEVRLRIQRRRRWLTPSHLEQVLAAVNHCKSATMTDIASTISAEQYGNWAMSGCEPSTRLRDMVEDLTDKGWLIKAGKKYSIPT